MGRRICPGRMAESREPEPALGSRPNAPPRAGRIGRLMLALALHLGLAAALHVASPAAAQTLGDRLAKNPAGRSDKMFVEAKELRYDTEKNTVSAEGDARVYYQGRVLEADRVVYDRNTGRVYAEGRAKLTEADGAVLHADRFDLTDDFRNGFIESLRAETPEKPYVNSPSGQGAPTAADKGTYKSYFSAPRAERIEGDTTVFDKGSYTACAACKDNPDKPPLWRVRAKRIIHKNDEQMIYYEDAALEFLGVPVAYVPFFSTPDPSVTRKSGILSPTLVSNSFLGFGTGIPIFWALAPNYDLTVTPTVYSQQGFFASAEWRHRLDNGDYSIRATGINQLNGSLFPMAPFDGGNTTLRGSVESKGKFEVADHWKFGWEFTLLSDKWYLNDYHVPSQTVSSNYFSETTSTVYLIGQADRGYFDLRGYHFEGLASQDIQAQQPNAHPVLDYDKTFDVDPAKTYGVGGQVEVDFNLTSLSATTASYQAVGLPILDNAFGLYNICNNYTPGQCLLRGIGGDSNRATLDLSWKRKIIDPLGEVWTPFAFSYLTGESLNLNTTNTYTLANNFASSTFTNASQLNFTGNRAAGLDGFVVPGVGLEYRYPFFAKISFASMTFEPIGQIIARPNNIIGTFSNINLDAQSLVFDASNLFDWSKYSGYDRFETGTRVNYGGQFSLNFNNGGYANVVAGQSYQLAGVNSYATPDAANVGLSSGLDTRLSDYVGSLTLAPSSAFSFMAKGRFDVNTFAPRRVDLITTYDFGAWTGNVQYANYAAQPLIGYGVRREGLRLYSRYQISKNYFMQGNVTFDMSRHLYPESIIGSSNPGLFTVANMGIGAGYEDECTTFSVNYSSIYQDWGVGSLNHNQTVLLQLQLRTLGEAKVSQTFLNTTALDGVRY